MDYETRAPAGADPSAVGTGVSDSELVARATRAREHAYVPYSGFAVGAALLTRSGEVFTGCNVENASYGLTVCAERVAIFNAVARGHREFRALAVVADTEGLCSPCGACRQVMAEFGDCRVILANLRGDRTSTSVSELLPAAFHFAPPGDATGEPPGDATGDAR